MNAFYHLYRHFGVSTTYIFSPETSCWRETSHRIENLLNSSNSLQNWESNPEQHGARHTLFLWILSITWLTACFFLLLLLVRREFRSIFVVFVVVLFSSHANGCGNKSQENRKWQKKTTTKVSFHQELKREREIERRFFVVLDYWDDKHTAASTDHDMICDLFVVFVCVCKRSI